MAQTSIKVLVTGSVDSKFKEVFAKIDTINAKHGPFDAVLCTGNFFAFENKEEDLTDLISGKVDVSIATYFITGNRGLPTTIENRIQLTGGEVCSNVFYLGKQGVLTTAQDLKIAFLSGAFNEDIYNTTESLMSIPNTYAPADIKKLKGTKMPLNAPAGVDILLTYEWPSTITHGSTVPLANPPNTSSTPIAEIAAVLKPRYHFSASENVFYEREPYKNTHGFGLSDEREADHVSRFIGLGNAFNTNKQRWFYAFNLVPLAKIEPEKLRAVPDTTTECPFKQLLVTAEEAAAGQKRSHEDGQGSNNGSFFWGADQKDPKRQATSAPPEHYICRRCNVPGHWVKDCPEANTLHKDYVCRKCSQPGHHIKDCPTFEQQDQSVPPEHYVCNICHVPGHFLRQCPEKDKERDLRRIMASDNLDACWFCLANPKVAKHLIVSIGSDVYATLAKGPLVAPGAKDAGVPGGGHIILIPITHYPTFKKIPMEAQIEVVAELEKYKGALRRMFEQYDQDIVVFETSRESFRGMTHAHIQVVPIPKSKSHSLEAIIKQTAAEQNIKFVERFIDNPEAAYFKIDLPNAKSFVHVIPPKARFNMQFGRLLLAKALERPEREDWKACSQSEEEERNAVNAFKAAFKPYDFTI